MAHSRSPYSGTGKKLVLAFDVGTTFSGISYSILSPGEVPEICGVNRYPAQGHVGGDSKIPTVLYYDKSGKVQAVGAEAVGEGIEATAAEQDWILVEWFKLHLRPSSMALEESIPGLPLDKSVVEIFGDYLAYLYKCAIDYIAESYTNGQEILDSVKDRQEFILTHPNGWEGLQQSYLREAIVRAGFMQDMNDPRIHLLTEGEAALHFCLLKRNQLAKEIELGGIIVVDAGGGTVDLSAYQQIKSSRKLSFEEISSPQCICRGSVFVTKHARKYLEERFEKNGPQWLSDLDLIVKRFDETTKLKFHDIKRQQCIRFGKSQDNDSKVGIKGGLLRLSGRDVASFFEVCVSDINKAIEDLCRASHATAPICSIFVVGGFAASNWLYNQVKMVFEPTGINVCRPDCHLNKVAADGAISYYLDHFVTSRVARETIGAEYYERFDPCDAEHVERLDKVFVDADGDKYIAGLFTPIIEKGTQVEAGTTFRASFFRMVEALDEVEEELHDKIYYCKGDTEPPWMDVQSERFAPLCTISTDTSRLKKRFLRKNGQNGKTYFLFEYDVVLMTGLTELKAEIRWRDRARDQRGRAKIMYDIDQEAYKETIIKN